MRVLFDHQIFSIQVYGGVSRYFYELMKNLKNDNGIECELSLQYSNNHYLKQPSNLPYRSFFKNLNFRAIRGFINILNKRISKKFISEGNYNIFHPTYYNPYFLDYIGSKPYVLTIYDMIHEIFPENFSSKDKITKYKKILVSKASKIIAISENTKKDIIKFYNIDETRIDVTYLATSISIVADIRSKNIKSKLPEKFMLFVGSRRGYKNFVNFIKAVDLLLKNNQSLFVVCVGGGDFNKHEKELLKSLSLQQKVFQFYVDDEELGVLYENALIFVFPSLYEGFGIPILEAFICKCPAVVSNSSCFPEIAGDAAEYFDPLSITSMENVIEKVIEDINLRKKLIEKGINRVKKFSWEKCARETKCVYESIL